MRLFGRELATPLDQAAFAVLATIMLSNAAWGWLFFRVKSTRGSFVAPVPYGTLVVALAALLLHLDRVAFAILTPYLAYLAYVTRWAYQVWRLNGPAQTA